LDSEVGLTELSQRQDGYSSLFPSAMLVRLTRSMLASLALLPLCSNAQTGSIVRSTSRFAYVANDNDDTISILAIERARLRAIGYVHVGKSTVPQYLAITPSQEFLYVSGEAKGISAYSVDSVRGALRRLDGSPFPAGARSQLTVDSSGKFLLAANANGLFTYAISPVSGSLTLGDSVPLVGLAGIAVTKSSVVYAVSSSANAIYAYTLDVSTGTLNPVEGSPFVTGLNPSRPALDPKGEFLFLPNSAEASVSVYSIDRKTGALKQVSGSPFPTGHEPVSAVTSVSGEFLYVGNRQDKTVSQYFVNRPAGVLTPLATPFSTGLSGPYSLTASPDEPLLYVSDHDSNEVLVLGHSPSGLLFKESLIRTRGPATSITIASGTGPVSWTPLFVYECNAGSNDVWGYAVSPLSGALVPLADSPFASGSSPSAMAGDIRGRFLFTANTIGHSISAYATSQTGALLPVAGSPFDNGQRPLGLATDADANFLYVSNPDANTLSGYRVDHSGELVKIVGSPFRVQGANPQGMVVDPRGKVLYVGNTNMIWSYRIDPESGALASIGSVQAGSQPVSLSVDRFGQYLYAANADSGSVSAYRIDGATGALSQVKSAPFPGASSPTAIGVDPFGNRLYVTQQGPSAVVGYSIVQNTGGLKLLSASPFLGVSAPTDMGFDLASRFAYVTNGSVNSISGFAIDQRTGTLTPLATTSFPAGAAPTAIEVVSLPD
jgi:6-phosphogluconolactonase (cycloisomerase 2 family)